MDVFESTITCPNCNRSSRPRVLDFFEDIDTDYIYDEDTGAGYDLISEFHLLRCKYCKFVYELYREEIVEGGEEKQKRWRSVKILKVNEGIGFDDPIQLPADILDRVIILECEQDMKQGTAFKLDGVGFITCNHVLGSQSYAFTKSNLNSKYKVTVLAAIPAIDLAIIDIPELNYLKGFEAHWDAELKQMDEIFIAGFPNYRWNDTGVLVKSAVSGFRTVSTIRRILSSSPIIGGNSGGPVFLRNGKVVGVAVTGADKMEDADKTEDHGIIPIDAIKKLIEETKKEQE